jgi:hypothetical protein
MTLFRRKIFGSKPSPPPLVTLTPAFAGAGCGQGPVRKAGWLWVDIDCRSKLA